MRKNLIKLSLNDASPQLQDAVKSQSFRVGIKNQADSVEMMIHGMVGDEWDGLDSGSIGRTLSDNRGKPINVRINSFGGLAWDGIAIYNELVQHDARVTVNIEGMAGSAASIIAMAGDEIKIAENGQFFIHEAWGFAVGNKREMADYIDFLSVLDKALASTYAARTGIDVEEIEQLMQGKVDGTTFTGPEAVERGFADEVIALKKKKDDDKDDEYNHKTISQAKIEQQRREQAARNIQARVLQIDTELSVR